MYLKPNSNWLQAGARFAARFYTDAPFAEQWTDFTVEPGVSNIYKTIAPAGDFEKVIFTRMNPANPANDWGQRWNQTGDLVWDGTSDLFTLAEGVWDGATTTWSVYEHPLAPKIPAGTELHVHITPAFWDNGTDVADHIEGYFYNASGDNWTVGTVVEPGVWKVVAPGTVGTDEWDKVIFVSIKAQTEPLTLDKWDLKVVQTGDLDWDGTSDLWDVATYTWQTFVPRTLITVTPSTYGINIDKVRIWIDRGGHYEGAEYEYALKVGEVYYNTTGTANAEYALSRFYLFFDLPKSELVGNVDFVVMDKDYYHIITLPTGVYTAGDNNKLWHVKLQGDPAVLVVTKGVAEARIHASWFALVLFGYLTCEPNAINGYGAFGDIVSNFLPLVDDGNGNMVWNMEGNLGGILINDFENEAAYTTGVREEVAATDAYAKYLAMKTLFEGTPGGTPIQDRVIESASSDYFLFGLVTLFVGFGLVSVLRLRKKNA